MRKVSLVLSLFFLSIFIAGCDNGRPFSSQNVPSKLKVLIERKLSEVKNEKLVVYAMDFNKEGQTLTFVCPCHIAGSSNSFLNVRVEGDSFKLVTLPGAEYKVEVTYWTPNNEDK